MTSTPRIILAATIETTASGLQYVEVGSKQPELIPWAGFERPVVRSKFNPAGFAGYLVLLAIGVVIVWLIPWLALQIVVGMFVAVGLLILLPLNWKQYLELRRGDEIVWLGGEVVDSRGAQALASDILDGMTLPPEPVPEQRRQVQIADYRCLGCDGSTFNRVREGAFRCTRCGQYIELFDLPTPLSEIEAMPYVSAAEQGEPPTCMACNVRTTVCLALGERYFRCPQCDVAWYSQELGRRMFGDAAERALAKRKR